MLIDLWTIYSLGIVVLHEGYNMSSRSNAVMEFDDFMTSTKENYYVTEKFGTPTFNFQS